MHTQHLTCDFESIPDGDKWTHTCKRCGRSITTHRQSAKRECLPTTGQQFKTVVTAAMMWVSQCSPVRSKSEQAAIMAICRDCEHYSPEKHRCVKCGCYLKQKIKMATESCPMGKWS